MLRDSTVFIVDDEPGDRQSLSWLVESIGLSAKIYQTAERFLEQYNPSSSGCLLLNIRAPSMGGLRLQQELVDREIRIPVIFIAEDISVPETVAAMKAGALEVFERPFDEQDVLEHIQQAIEIEAELRRVEFEHRAIRESMRELTNREREVFDSLVQGMPVKRVALEIGLSRRTIAAYRANVMQKLGVDSTAALVRLAASLQIGRPIVQVPRALASSPRRHELTSAAPVAGNCA